MKPVGRVIFEAADKTEYYPFVWDQSLEIALLSAGACTIRQGGQAYALQATTTPPSYTDGPVVATVNPTAAISALQQAQTLLQGQVGNLLTVLTKQDPTAAIKAVKTELDTVSTTVTALAAPAPASTLGNIAITGPDGAGGSLIALWVTSNATDTPPTLTYNGKPLPVLPVANAA